MSRSDKILTWVFGTSLATFVIHWTGQPFLNAISIAQLSFLVSILCIPYYFATHKVTWELLGDRKLYVPLALIVGCFALRPVVAALTGVSQLGLSAEIASMFYGVYLFGVYIMCRSMGTEVFKPFTWGVVIASLSCILMGVINPGVKTGGFVSVTNYDIATGFIVFGLFVSVVSKQWWLSTLAIVGLFFTGADEAIFATVCMLIIILVRRDWSLKLLAPVGALIITITICTPLGITASLYNPALQKVGLVKEVVEDTAVGKKLDTIVPDVVTDALNAITAPLLASENTVNEEKDTDELLDKATGFRYVGNWRLPPIQPFGYGFNLTNFYIGIPHNTWLIIVHQLGVGAAICWTLVVLFGLLKTRYKYAWCAIIVLSIFDHFVWTQAAPFMWALAGVSSVSNIKEDLIYKKVM